MLNKCLVARKLKRLFIFLQKHEDEMKSVMAEKRTLEKKLLSIQEELENSDEVAKELESVKKE